MSHLRSESRPYEERLALFRSQTALEGVQQGRCRYARDRPTNPAGRNEQEVISSLSFYDGIRGSSIYFTTGRSAEHDMYMYVWI